MQQFPDMTSIPKVVPPNAPAANTAAVLTIVAPADEYVVLDFIAWSYDAAPTGGNLLIEIGGAGGTAVFTMDIAAEGQDVILFPERGFLPSLAKEDTIVITLAAGGAAVTGKLSAQRR